MIVSKGMKVINGLFPGARGMNLQMSIGQVNIVDGTWKGITMGSYIVLK